MDPLIGEIIVKEQIKTTSDDLVTAIDDVRKGTFQPERENDELTRALGNLEHGGQTWGKGVIPWVVGSPECNDSYRSYERKRSRRQTDFRR